MRISLVDPSLFTLPYDAALARSLAAEGHQVRLHGRRRRRQDGEAPDLDLAEDFYAISESRLARALPKPLRLAIKGVDHVGCMARLRRRLRRARPDVIHFQWLPLPVVDACLLGRFRTLAPLVLTVHDTDPFNGSPTARLQGLGIKAAFAGFDRLVVHTRQGQARLVAQGIDAGRITVLPHGSLSTSRQVLAAPARGPLTFLLFGKIKPYKGADLLIEAFALLPPSLRSQARIRIVGQPYMDLEALHALALVRGIAEHVSIEPDFIPDDAVDGLFDSRTVAVFPYREIEASGVLSYAIANGRPIIASRLGSFAETLRDRVHGRLVPAGDVAALRTALADMIADRVFAETCASSVALLARAMPQWPDIARGTLRLYAEAVRGERRGAGVRGLPAPGLAA